MIILAIRIFVSIYTNKAKRIVCLRVCPEWPAITCMSMAPCFGHVGVTFDVENDRPGPGSLRGHFEAARGQFRVCPEWPAMPCMEWLLALGIQG